MFDSVFRSVMVVEGYFQVRVVDTRDGEDWKTIRSVIHLFCI